jgi:hypothetical protein
VSDRPSRGDLSQYFLISPWDGEPRVDWHRRRISVKPRHGFRPNTAYIVTMLPGLADIRGNTMPGAASVVFATGAAFPRFVIRGTIFDWAAERPAAGALVEAIGLPDSVRYLTAADSLGSFSLGPFDAGRYLLRGLMDRNNNRAIDPGEPWDTTTIVVNAISPVAELYAITRDTIPPRITTVARDDSMTIRVTFDRPLDPDQRLSPELFRVQRPDSTDVPIASVTGAREAAVRAAARDTSNQRDTTTQRRDTTARRDTSAAAGLPPSAVPLPAPRGQRAPLVTPPPAQRAGRPPPETAVLLKLAPQAQLAPATTYRVTARDVRNIQRKAGTSSRTFTTPRLAPPAARDSAGARPTRRPPADHRSR